MVFLRAQVNHWCASSLASSLKLRGISHNLKDFVAYGFEIRNTWLRRISAPTVNTCWGWICNPWFRRGYRCQRSEKGYSLVPTPFSRLYHEPLNHLQSRSRWAFFELNLSVVRRAFECLINYRNDIKMYASFEVNHGTKDIHIRNSEQDPLLSNKPPLSIPKTEKSDVSLHCLKRQRRNRWRQRIQGLNFNEFDPPQQWSQGSWQPPKWCRPVQPPHPSRDPHGRLWDYGINCPLTYIFRIHRNNWKIS